MSAIGKIIKADVGLHLMKAAAGALGLYAALKAARALLQRRHTGRRTS